jgi:hypothetical protein
MIAVLATDNFVYIADRNGEMRRCGPTPSSAGCTLFNKLASYKSSYKRKITGGGPMAVLNSSHIIATSANDMV